MKRVHIIGRKGHGKTQLVVDLIVELSRQGFRVGSIKHTHHEHELDVPGKDSHRHRMSGAAVVGIISRSMSAVFLPAEHQEDAEDRYAAFAPMFADCDLVIVEGDRQTNAMKLEVWRAELATDPIAITDKSVRAIVTDDPLDAATEVLPRSDIAALASWLKSRIQSSPGS